MCLGRNEESLRYAQAAHELLLQNESAVKPHDAQFVRFSLGLAWFRIGETENCIHCNNCASCLFPIRGAGVHNVRRGSENAIKAFTEALEHDPNDLASRWLLNVAYMTLGRYPKDVPPQYLIPPERLVSEEPFPRFLNVAAGVGITPASLAGGAIADDFDGDDLLDIVITSWDRSESIQFYKNNGDGTLADRSKEAGFEGVYGGLNCMQADYDNDGDLDILVLRGAWLDPQKDPYSGRHPRSLLANDGKGHFRDRAIDAGLAKEHFPSQTAAWADFDNDGDLDLYIGNERFRRYRRIHQGCDLWRLRQRPLARHLRL
jgi:hypothetical protein